MKRQIALLDSTLRDGAQGEGISFSVEDKIKIVTALDALGISYIEAGNPGSNQKDLEFFKRMEATPLRHAKLSAFGSTRRKGVTVQEDEQVQALLSANTDTVIIFGKSWDFHVTEIIKTTLDENLTMVSDTLSYFKDLNKEVIFDAEHFFDGYRANPEYALSVLRVAESCGVSCIVLCDTNGGTFPEEVYAVTKMVCTQFSTPIGIHSHNDCGMAVANAMMAVSAGAEHVQGTYIGFGERCGNANLSTLIGNLQVKGGHACIPSDQVTKLTTTAHFVAEIANLSLEHGMPFVGPSAFAHKGGMHIDGVMKNSHSFEHLIPEKVGNARSFLMSEVSGRSTLLAKIQRVAPKLKKDQPEVHALLNKIKEMEHFGYQFEGAESSFELLVRRELGLHTPHFAITHFKIISEHPAQHPEMAASSILKIKVGDQEELTATQGNGPINALDQAIRKALEVFYPVLKAVHLVDYKVRVLDSGSASGAKVRVLIESTDGQNNWSSVGVSTDIIQASLIALTDSMEYKLSKEDEATLSLSAPNNSPTCHTTELKQAQ
jgi:2-isopropylmalate synthase